MHTEKSKRVQFTIQVPPFAAGKLREISKARVQTQGQVITDALDCYFKYLHDNGELK